MERIYEWVEKNIDNLVENNVDWTACATSEQMQEAREGRLKLIFFEKYVPVEWLADIKGKKVLCLAGAGGLHVCDFIEEEEGGYYKVVNRMPYCSADFDDSNGWIEYGHTMEEYIGGQIACGFCINGYVECQLEDITELHFMTRAVKTTL